MSLSGKFKLASCQPKQRAAPRALILGPVNEASDTRTLHLLVVWAAQVGAVVVAMALVATAVGAAGEGEVRELVDLCQTLPG